MVLYKYANINADFSFISSSIGNFSAMYWGVKKHNNICLLLWPEPN